MDEYIGYTFSGPDPADRLAAEREVRFGPAYVVEVGRPHARAVALCVNGAMVWTEADPESPAAALERYFARLQPKKAPDPKALPALSGLTRTAFPARRGPGWCDE